MLGKQSCGSLLPTFALTVGMAGAPLAASQKPNEEDIKQADAKINALTQAVAGTKRQMETANLIANSAKASKNLPPKLAYKAVTEAQYRKDVYILMNLERVVNRFDFSNRTL